MAALTDEDREAIRRLTEQQWTSAALARNWDMALAMCADEVVYMPPDHDALHGHAELRAWLDQFPPILKFTQPLETLEGQGNMAISRTRFAVTVETAGSTLENTGKALCGWQKDASGRWVVNAVCWNWDRPTDGGA